MDFPRLDVLKHVATEDDRDRRRQQSCRDEIVELTEFVRLPAGALKDDPRKGKRVAEPNVALSSRFKLSSC